MLSARDALIHLSSRAGVGDAIPAWLLTKLNLSEESPAMLEHLALDKLHAWLVANPHELKKCKSASAIIRTVDRMIGTNTSMSLPGTEHVRTVSVRTVMMQDLLMRCNPVLNAAKQAAIDICALAARSAAVTVSPKALAVQVKVQLADGAKDAWTASQAATAAAEMIRRHMIERSIPHDGTMSIGHLVGKNGKRLATLLNLLGHKARNMCTGEHVGPLLQSPRLKITVLRTYIHVAVLAVPRRNQIGETAACLAALELALSSAGDELASTVASWLHDVGAMYKRCEEAYRQRCRMRNATSDAVLDPADVRDWVKERLGIKRDRDARRDLRRRDRQQCRRQKTRAVPGRQRLRAPYQASKCALLAFEHAMYEEDLRDVCLSHYNGSTSPPSPRTTHVASGCTHGGQSACQDTASNLPADVATHGSRELVPCC